MSVGSYSEQVRLTGQQVLEVVLWVAVFYFVGSWFGDRVLNPGLMLPLFLIECCEGHHRTFSCLSGIRLLRYYYGRPSTSVIILAPERLLVYFRIFRTPLSAVTF